MWPDLCLVMSVQETSAGTSAGGKLQQRRFCQELQQHWSEFSCFIVSKCLCTCKCTAAGIWITAKDSPCHEHAGKLVNQRHKGRKLLFVPGSPGAFLQEARIAFQCKMKLWILGFIWNAERQGNTP